MRQIMVVVSVLVAAGLLARPPLIAQVRPVYDLGAAGLTQVLQRLQTTASAMHTGAHPDDEDSAFMARTARGDHARVAYLSLNRGEGGQNIIGSELFDALGVVRTEELLQARRLDGGEQFFTRTFDYGFSKTREEAATKWNERETLGDMVRVIRMFRPLVIYARFTGTPADGHGHHQFAGYLTPLAFRAAADPNAFPEQIKAGLRPWQARKLYRGAGFRPDPANPPTVLVQAGAFDPVLGRSFGEISAEGRSQHKSQEMGSIEPRGPQVSGLIRLEGGAPPGPNEQSIFDGIDVSVPGLAALAGLAPGALQAELQVMDRAARQALAQYKPLEPTLIIPSLAEGLRAARAARRALESMSGSATAREEADFLLAFKERDFVDALARAAGTVVDPLAAEETVVPGGTLAVAIRTFVPQGGSVKVVAAGLTAPAGWRVETATGPVPTVGVGQGRVEIPTHTAQYRVVVPRDAPLTQPYFLTAPRRGDRYEWAENAPHGLPFDPPLLTARVSLEVGGVAIEVSRAVQYRFADRVRGELRRDVNVVPPVVVSLDSPLLIVPLGSTPHEQRVIVRATSFSAQPVSGTLQLKLPEGWTSTPASVPFTLQTRDDRTSASFMVTAPASRTSGAFDLTAEAQVGTTVFSRDMEIVAYPHIQTHRLYWPATATAQVLDLKVAPVSVGYIMGSGDHVPDALRRMGIDVTLMDDETLATGDLSRFDTIMIGIRASEARPEFVASNARLIEYMERGGTLIVQYQQADYAARNLLPYPATAPPRNNETRVTDETAPVTILEPAHPVMTFPNRITEEDFRGWVQERNLWGFVEFDARYTPLLESADRGDPPQRGAAIYAEVGKGRYVYTGYAWFRQLPAGVPGAYRQLANLVSLSKAPRGQ